MCLIPLRALRIKPKSSTPHESPFWSNYLRMMHIDIDLSCKPIIIAYDLLLGGAAETIP